MKVLIVEDEYGALQNLLSILPEVDSSIEVIAEFETVEETVKWLKEGHKPNLGFFDIRIADGLSFQIFEEVDINFPVIFTTAYDEFALEAFKVKGIDYLMKPIDKKELESSLTRFSPLFIQNETQGKSLNKIESIGEKFKNSYNQSFLVFIRDRILPIRTSDIAYFMLDNGYTICTTFKGRSYKIDLSLNKIQQQLNPKTFFRANRQFLVSRNSIKSAIVYGNRKLKLEIEPKSKADIIISKMNSLKFKKWIVNSG